ncbi:MAG: transporter substrate-binding domain-containing protein [Draconibacterium sp.]|nr:transporter substrate-binding domain-containing protein [Draconibacterium sp.]
MGILRLMQYLNKYKSLFFNIILLCVVVIATISCGRTKQNKDSSLSSNSVKISDLQRVKNSRVLKAVVDYNSTNYFVYRGKPMGFKYDMLQELAKELDVELEISVSNNLSETFDGLKTGRFDLVAKNLTITKERSEQIDFTVPIYQTKQVLIQRVKRKSDTASYYISSILELADKKIYVQKNSSYFNRLQNLSEEIGSNIEIVEDTIFGVEQLVAQVAKGEFDYTVCDENIAKLNKTYYSNLDVSLAISFDQNIAWAVQKGSFEWKNYLDTWISTFKKTRKYKILYHKYFESPRVASRMESDFHSIRKGKISEYDNIVKEIANEYNWDWRLVSSIIYHESRFNAEAGSWAGAYGLMQIMPTTAKGLGIEDYHDPKQNIKGGVLLMNWLNNQFLKSIPDSTERVKFVLASYNIGMGHVKDAQRLAEKYGKNRFIWEDNVDFFLLNKSSEKYYKDPVCRFGYCRGVEAYNYVSRVLGNYNHYLNVIPK